MKRLHVMGASGSGATTLAQALAKRLQRPHFDSDDYFWEPTEPPYRRKREREQRLAMLAGDLAKVPAWILSGCTCGWGDAVEDAADLIVFLHIPPDIRLARLRVREIERHGCVNEEFIAWAALYEAGDLSVRSRARHEWWLGCRRRPILRLETDLTVEQRVAAVLARMEQD
jgi:adenylate kinase family enzyme